MRDIFSSMKLVPSLMGTLSGTKTAVGAPVDTMGFADCLAMVLMGAVGGTDANQSTVTIKIQESAVSTGTNWSDIANGAITGTFAFDAVLLSMAGTSADNLMYMAKKYERLQIGRLRYIRAHATIAGTDACNPKVAVSFLLARPCDTLYSVQGATQASGNLQFYKGV